MHNAAGCQVFRGGRGQAQGAEAGTQFASLIAMSRVKPKHQEPASRQSQQNRRSEPRRTPEKAEGEERTIDEALRNEEKKGR